MISGRAYLERLKLRVADRDAPASKPAAIVELAAIREWGVIPKTDRFAVLGQIVHPTLIVHGSGGRRRHTDHRVPFSLSISSMLRSSRTQMRATAHIRSDAENFLENVRPFLSGSQFRQQLACCRVVAGTRFGTRRR